MKISKLSISLFVLCCIIAIMGAVSVHQLTKEKKELVKQKDAAYEQLYLQFQQEREQLTRDNLALGDSLRASNLRRQIDLRTVDSLQNELKRVPKRYTNVSAKKLGELMDKRADGN